MKLLSDYQVGATVEYHGEPCLILEHRKDGTLLLVLEQIKHTFGEKNDFAKSALLDHLNGPYLDTLTHNNRGDIIPRAIDLTALNGSTEYGTCVCKVAPLTLDELRRYHSILPKPESWEWSATPWSTPCVDEDEVWLVGLFSDGGICCFSCTDTYGARPAFLLPSNYVVEPESTLAQYTDDELLAEISRRLNKE